MGTVRLVPAYQFAASDAAHPVIVSGDPATLWGDSDDSTYVEFWRDAVSGGAATGQLVADPATYQSATLYVRAMLMVSGNATESANVLAVDVSSNDTAQFFGSYLADPQPTTGDVILDLDSWAWYEDYPDAMTDMLAALTTSGGLKLDLSRGSSEAVAAPYEYGMRAYEFNFVVTTSGGIIRSYRARQRLYPIAPARRWPREAWTGRSSRRVGGYR